MNEYMKIDILNLKEITEDLGKAPNQLKSEKKAGVQTSSQNGGYNGVSSFCS